MDSERNEIIAPYAIAVVRLLQGTVFEEDKKAWNMILAYQSAVRAFFAQIGVALYLDEKDGFAFLTQEGDDENEKGVPRLIRRMPLSYEVTLLLVILRESLEEFDLKNTDATRCFITDDEIKERIELMFREKADKVKLLSRIDGYISQAANLGFLKEVDPKEGTGELRRYEIRRVIRAKMNNEKLEEIKEKLRAHNESV